jgi:RimJ/RimL family protein N-acetyltransferase
METNIWSGSKVILRPVLPADWKAFHSNDFDSESARLYEAIHFPRSEEGTRSWTERETSKRSIGDNVMLAIETLDGQLVGSISTSSCEPRHGTFKYGVAIFRAHWRKGYASEAVRILLRYYFEELRYQKANAYVYAINENSIRLQEHLGFVQEGKLRNMIFTNGQYIDEFVYGLTKYDYDKLKIDGKSTLC